MENIRKAGVLAHPTCFPGDYGIGDIGQSTLRFLDFLEKGCQTLWQILPMGPTSFGDSPYQSFSAFAGNTLLISPERLLEEGYITKEELDACVMDDKKIAYGNVIEKKNALYKKAYKRFCTHASQKQRQDFACFCKENDFWLKDYCLFVSLKDYFIEKRRCEGFTEEWEAFKTQTKGILEENLQKDYYFGAVWVSWPKELAFRQERALKKWQDALAERIEFYRFLQYEFFRQWSLIKVYAKQKSIQIVGDIPIFVAYDSADVWANPSDYYIDEKGFPTVVAGVPPDYFSSTGQLWGNPLYHWQVHEEKGYSWWMKRIENTLKMVDILRIDHFRAFESFWAVPFCDKDATRGKWMKGPGEKLFDMAQKSLGTLPIIAEDLGIITEEVTLLRQKVGFPGMKVLQFAFDGSPNNAYLPHNFDKNTVVYTGTHDNDTTIGWYHKAPEKQKDLFRRYMNVSGDHPSWDFIRLALASVAKYAVYPIQDILELDSQARMNTPSYPAGNWQFRFEWNMLKDEYAQRLAYLTKLFGRC